MGKKNKRLLVGGVAVSLLIVAVLFGQIAGCRPFHGGHWGKFGSERCLGRDFSEHALKHFDSHVEELNLTDEQKERYVQIRMRAKAHMENNAEKRKAFFEDLKTEMDKENPDINAAAERVKKGLKDFEAAMEEHVNLFMAFYEILDENQKSEVIQRFKKRM
ncbi:Spy/CpxP family protein refolding chaperone [Thermodesulfobacteriota bacterium]